MSKKILFCAALVLAIFAGAAQKRQVMLDRVVAVVGGSSILWSEVDEYAGELVEQRRQQGYTSDRDPHDEALEQLLMQKLLFNQALIDSVDVSYSGIAQRVEAHLQALIDAVEAGSIDGEIVLVLANASKAFALERARRHGIPAEFISKKQAGSDEAFNDVILQRLRAVNADLVVLAGYLPIVGRQIVRAFEHRIINIHPALIPAFCGPGMYGHHVHEAVLAYGAKISGATTHFVDEQVDHGGVIMQKSVPVLEGDTPETLAARVLAVEHEILPESVRLFCAEKLGVDGRQVHVL